MVVTHTRSTHIDVYLRNIFLHNLLCYQSMPWCIIQHLHMSLVYRCVHKNTYIYIYMLYIYMYIIYICINIYIYIYIYRYAFIDIYVERERGNKTDPWQVQPEYISQPQALDALMHLWQKLCELVPKCAGVLPQAHGSANLSPSKHGSFTAFVSGLGWLPRNRCLSPVERFTPRLSL